MKKLSVKKITAISARHQWCLALMCLFLALLSAKALGADEPSSTENRAASQVKIPSIPGVAPDEFESREARKVDLVDQKISKEKIIAGAPDVAQRSALAAPPFTDISLMGRERHVLPDELYHDETILENAASPSPKGVEAEGAVIMPLGEVRVIKNAAFAAQKAYFFLNEKVSAFRKPSEEKVTRIDPEKLPEEVKTSLERLSEVEGVSVSIPGADLVASLDTGDKVAPKYSVGEDIFTIDGISLEKTAKGDFVSRVPGEAARDFDNKKLCFSSSRDAYGKTVAMKIESGCAETMAKVLAKWAKYSRLGFEFDKKTEEKVVKGIIKIMGVGVDDAFVRLEERQVSAGVLEEEIRKIVGDDNDAMMRIAAFIRPGNSDRPGKTLPDRNR